MGKENIPKDGPILFIANHQNALIDAILIPTTTKREIHFLTRASAFTTNLISKFLKSLNMIPVYRIRDGFNTIEKNVSVFEQCFDILKNEGAVEIFAEGAHHLKRQIMPLKKGFARIILGTLQKYPHLNIQIVPIGINYDSHLNFPSSVSIHYGQPILANNFVNTENPDLRFTAIINEVTIALKNLTLHIKDDANYDETISKLNSANVDFTNPIEAAELLQNINSISETKPTKSSVNWFFPIHLITKLNSILPLLIWLYLKSKISDIVFTNTYRFALILTVFPLFYIIQTLIIYYFYNSYYALIYLGISILLGIISTKTMSINKE
ncbi:MAG: acyltransferase [Lutibacter sp.]|uniref:1-acyl-sn-glycerol-3-phosphate acyltransferase n=1 Tax=Lutibacter sp. TaxID=1925666 RepID=UPI0017FA4309|nr:1-acyl-sn-glycerol-3-phosphate acyltransferase [Lutibacter sp.]MBT8317512.1 1-acyl-sn-glycerol-3-phosphate acyltransferase [Lutibacter sp.]NNJ58371.1 acyltransferase [Lutibacter sp.]